MEFEGDFLRNLQQISTPNSRKFLLESAEAFTKIKRFLLEFVKDFYANFKKITTNISRRFHLEYAVELHEHFDFNLQKNNTQTLR